MKPEIFLATPFVTPPILAAMDELSPFIGRFPNSACRRMQLACHRELPDAFAPWSPIRRAAPTAR
jgi:hypothetical protein